MPAATIAFSSVGSTISIAAAVPATFDAAGYAALTWKEIGEVDDIGEFGATDNLVSRTPLKTGAMQKLKGSTNFGSLPLQMAMVPGDAGHIELKTARASKQPWSVKVLFQDGSIEYFRALVMSYKKTIGAAEGFTKAATTLEITTGSVEVAPA